MASKGSTARAETGASCGFFWQLYKPPILLATSIATTNRLRLLNQGIVAHQVEKELVKIELGSNSKNISLLSNTLLKYLIRLRAFKPTGSLSG